MNTNIDERSTYVIENGPSKDLLFDACKYAYSSEVRIRINFSVAIACTMKPGDSGCAYVPMKVLNFRIISIEHEDGSGDRFNIYGHCDAATSENTDSIVYSPYKFRAYYDTRQRRGRITFIEY